MKKPENYDAAQPTLTLAKPKAGYYAFEILHAEEAMSRPKDGKPSKPMLVLHLDIAEGEYKGYFMNRWRMDKKFSKEPDKVYYRAVYRKVTENIDSLKADITAIEQSNNFKFDWDERSLIGKKVGCGVCEYEYYSYKYQNIGTDVDIISRLVPVKLALSGNLVIPRLRKLDERNNQGSNDDYGPTPENKQFDDDLPF